MRPYRGLTKEGKWVYGWYCVFRFWGEHIIMVDNPPNLEDFEVIPETVGQSTGLTDKNGKEIYHHDIVNDKAGYKWEIMWGNAQFYLLSVEKDLLPDKYKFEGDCEVIGNIYQNPELLKNGNN